MRAKLTIEQMQALAQARNGVCLSETYGGANLKLRWRCAEGHEWKARPISVKNDDTWCPTCSQGNNERIVGDICKQLFGTPFPKARPKWLRNSRGNQMELDGYCKKLSLAFEYQGRQHYEPSSVFHTGRQTLGQRKADDARKRQLCRANGVHLLAIPYTVELDDVPAYIVAAVKNLGVLVSMRPPDTIKVSQFVLPEKLRSMQVLAKEHDGECLSIGYVNSATVLRWRCAEGHEWEATPNNVKSKDTWCPECGSTRLTIEQMQVLAREHDGVCLSTVYVNSYTKLRWRCVEGHEWRATPSSVKKKRWCPRCARTRRSLRIEQMQALAKAHDGVCLSTVYVNNATKLRWRCAEGHEWKAVAVSVKNNDSWCPECAGVLRGTIKQMQALAQARNGVCLSETYGGANLKLRWRCAEGHEWEATPSSVKNSDRWCPRCGIARRASGRADTIEQMQALAKKRGGKCLSTVYVNEDTKLRWRCSEGHEWETTPSTMKVRVKRGYWCTKCPRVA